MGNRENLALGRSHYMHPIFSVFKHLLETMGITLSRNYDISKKELQEECYRLSGEHFQSKAEFVVAFEAFFELYETLVVI